MPMPTRKSVLAELNKWSRHTNPKIAYRATDVSKRLQLLSADTPNEAEKLAKDLVSLLNEQNESSAFLKAVYKALILVGIEFPVNARDGETGQILDMISSTPIPAKYLFVSSDRYQWNIKTLMSWKNIKLREWRPSQHQNPENRFVFINPFTTVPFTEQDLHTMGKIVRRTNSGLTFKKSFYSYFGCCFFNQRQVQPILEITNAQIEEYQRNLQTQNNHLPSSYIYFGVCPNPVFL